MSAGGADLTVLVNCHSEGYLLFRTLKALQRSIDFAHKDGLEIDVLAVLDRPSAETEAVLRDSFPHIQTLAVDFGDLGVSRNAGVRAVKSKYVAFLDGDDIFAENWLLSAYSMAEAGDPGCVYHPEYSLTFEKEWVLWRRYSSDDARFPYLALIQYNPYDALAFGPRQVFEAWPYRPASGSRGFGFEDWLWDCDTIGGGVVHKVVPETVLFIRRKNGGSMVQTYAAESRFILPSVLFEPKVYMQFTLNHPGFQAQNINEVTADARVKQRRRIARAVAVASSDVVRFGYDLAKPMLKQGVNRMPLPIQAQLRTIRQSIKLPRGEQLIEIPAWLEREWAALNSVEPALLPIGAIKEKVVEYRIPSLTTVDVHYLELCKTIATGHIDDLFVVPWLKTGGADKVVLNYIQAMHKLWPARRILVLATETIRSEWQSRLPKNVEFMSLLERPFADLSPTELDQLLIKFLQGTKVKRIHLINSPFFFAFLSRHARTVTYTAQIYVHAYCPEYTEEGFIFGWPFEPLNLIFDWIEGVISENKSILGSLRHFYGYRPEKLHCVYQPVQTSKREVQGGSELRVLWAGRLDRQKRPDLLLNIAKRLEKVEGVHLDIYGKPMLEQSVDVANFAPLANTTYHGPYDGFESIPLDGVSVLLYTSDYDGMPNVVLEGLGANLAVVASNVGGIHEVIQDGKNGVLVSSNNDVDGFVEALTRLRDNPELIELYTRSTQGVLATQHGSGRFEKAVQDLFE
jgi:glycosyltransferase involved in cell wall biosynthesis